jgi:hypothetical protein
VSVCLRDLWLEEREDDLLSLDNIIFYLWIVWTSIHGYDGVLCADNMDSN